MKVPLLKEGRLGEELFYLIQRALLIRSSVLVVARFEVSHRHLYGDLK